MATDPDPIDRACDIVEGHARCAKAVRTTRWNEPPGVGSAGAADLVAQSEYRAGWTQAPVEAAVSLAALYMEAAEDHLVGLTRVSRPPRLVASPFTMARGTLEAAARAWLLVDPTCSVEERIARGVNERLYGLREKAKEDKAFKASADAQCDALLQGAVSVGIPLTAKGAWVLRGRYENTALVDEMIESIDAIRQGGIYRSYTAIAHSVLGGLAALIEADDDRPGAGRLVLSRPALFDVISVCVLTHEAAFDRALDYIGWHDTPWSSWKAHAHDVLIECQQAVNDGNA